MDNSTNSSSQTTDTNDLASAVLEPSVKIFLTQATYEYVVAKYFTEKERDAWEQKFSQHENSPEIIADFIKTLETKSKQSLSQLMQSIQSRVTHDISDALTETMIEALATKNQPSTS